MSITGVKAAAGFNDDANVEKALARIAAEIAREANRTSAKVGFVSATGKDGKGVFGWVGWSRKGVAALPLEIGTSRQPARRFVKRALDRRRI